MKLQDHLEKLPYFYAVAQEKGLKKASQVVGITQPSLTKSIKSLELALGGSLFERRPRGMILTEKGRLLESLCHEMFGLIKDFDYKWKSPKDPFAGSLRVGTYDSIGIFFWPYFLRDFLPKFPKLGLELTMGRSLAIQDMLENHSLDLALSISPPTKAHFVSEVLAYDSFFCYQGLQNQPIYNNVNEAPIIYMPDALVDEDSLEVLINKMNFSQRVKHKSTSLESIKELVIQGLGIGLLPSFVAKDQVGKGLLEQVRPEKFPQKGIGKHSMALSFLKHQKENPLINLLTDQLRSAFQKF